MNKDAEDREREANYFARCLLMPREFILRDTRDGVDLSEDEQVKRLAKKYGVSMALMAMRIYEVHNGLD